MLQLNELNRVEDPKPKGQKRYFSNEELLQRYKVYMRKKGISVDTFERRETEIKKYFKFLDFIKQKTIYKINGDTFARYLEYLKQNNFATAGQETALRGLRAFYVWLKEENVIEGKNNIFDNGRYAKIS